MYNPPPPLIGCREVRRVKGKRVDLGQPWARLLFLGLFFLSGVILGQVCAGHTPDAAGNELERYLRDFAAVTETEGTFGTALTAAALYFRYPMAAFLLGFGAAGIVLLPGLTAAFGFFLSFSVCCFAAVFGPEGVLLAAAVMGLRCAVTLPCYFLLAVPAWESACLPRGKRRNGWDRGRWVRLGAVCLALLAGLWAELMLSPWLLDAALARVVV